MKTKIICEIGSNWRSLDDWKRYISFNRKYGFLTKGQLWIADRFINKKRNPKAYQICRRFQVPQKWVQELAAPDVFWTAFDRESLTFLTTEINPLYYKVAALDSNQSWMIDQIARTNRKAFVSAGIYGLESIRDIVKIFYTSGHIGNLTLMHSISDYPVQDAQLGYLKDRINGTRTISWGLSYNGNHSVIPLAAVSLGAEALELHVKIDHINRTPDAKHSFDIKELNFIRDSIELIENNMGNSERPLKCELKHIKVGRRKWDGKR